MIPQRILVVGAGVAGSMAAAALARAARGRTRIVLADVLAPETGVLAAMPGLRDLHGRLGISESALAASGAASPVLGLLQEDALIPFGDTGAMLDGVAFHHHWRRAGTGALADWSLAAQAARRGRFAPPSPDPRSPLSTLDYGYRLDAAPYTALLRGAATAAGVEVVTGAVANVETDPAGVAAVVLDDGRRLEADLFVDATDGLLIAALGEPWLDWDVRAMRAVGGRAVLTRFEADPTAPKAGRRARAYVGNCVAVGAAAGVARAADGGELRCLQAAVTRLCALLPAGDGEAGRAEFNRLSGLALERARDMALLRWGELSALPDLLDRKRAQFESRGRVVMYDEDAWPEMAWVHAFLARDVVPERWDPLAERVPLDRARDMLARMKAVLETTAEGMARYG